MRNILNKPYWIIVGWSVWIFAACQQNTPLMSQATATIGRVTPNLTIEESTASSPTIAPEETATPPTTATIPPTATFDPTLEATVVDSLFGPQLEELLDCVSAAWWAEEDQAIYFQKCPTFNGPQEGLWRLDLTTREVTQIGETPPRGRVPTHFLSLIPDSVRDVLVYLSPSGERVIYLEQLDPYRNLPTPTPVADPADLGELSLTFEYLVYFINQSGDVVNLGQIRGFPSGITWSEDEQVVFMTTQLMHGDAVPGGWLADMEELTLEEMTPPTYDGSVYSLHFCFASLQPNGEAIMYRLCFGESGSPYLLWNYRTGEIQEIENYGPFYVWLEGSRYLLFSDEKALVRYDLETGEALTIMPDANAFFGPWRNIQYLSPQGDRLIFPRIRNSNPRGLWLLTFNVE